MDNPWLERRVLNWAHQGGAREWPSSTLFALRNAVGAGAHAIELDVHATSDHHLVVCHDTTVDRTTDGTGRIADLTLEQVRRLDNAYWFVPGRGDQVTHDLPAGAGAVAYTFRGRAPADTSFVIATMEEVLDAFPHVFLNFDIKRTAPEVEPYEHLVADTLRAFGRVDDVIVASFNDVSTDRFAEQAPDVATSFGTAGTAAFYQAVRAGERPPATRHRALQVPATYGDITLVDEEFVDAAHRHGLAVHVWTIDDPDEMRHLLGLGVDGIMTDYPSVLADVLSEEGLAYDVASTA